MKKVYNSPWLSIVDLHTENIIAGSITISEGTAEQWTNKKSEGWNDFDWCNNKSTEEE